MYLFIDVLLAFMLHLNDQRFQFIEKNFDLENYTFDYEI